MGEWVLVYGCGRVRVGVLVCIDGHTFRGESTYNGDRVDVEAPLDYNILM
jgi:hypothetical protein